MSVHVRELAAGRVHDVRWRDADGANRSRSFDDPAEAARFDEAMRVAGALRRASLDWDRLTPAQRAWASQEIAGV